MKRSDQQRALAAAIHAARKAGQLMRANLHRAKVVNESSSHDIKLQLDVRCQQVITRALHRAFPGIALLGEEGDSGRADTAYRWVVDPIDGTVNFAYSIPHASVSIALQERIPGNGGGRGDYKTVLGVVLDPFLDEVWTATEFDPPRLNGRPADKRHPFLGAFAEHANLTLH